MSPNKMRLNKKDGLSKPSEPRLKLDSDNIAQNMREDRASTLREPGETRHYWRRRIATNESANSEM